MGSTFGACVAYLATFIVTNIMKKVLMLFHVSFKWDLKLSATPSSSNISQQHWNADGRINDIASSKRIFILKKKDSYYLYKVLLIVWNYSFDEKEKKSFFIHNKMFESRNQKPQYFKREHWVIS